LELTTKELQQVSVGNVLFLKGLWLATVVALHRGAVILEHPVVPFEDFKPSIWRTAIVNLLMRPPFSLFARTTIHQWRYGSPGVKPKTLLYAHLDLKRAPDDCSDPNAVKPTDHLIGRTACGEFAPAAAKEYPSALNLAFATAFARRLATVPWTDEQSYDATYGQELATLGARMERSTRLPDYQTV
jgi:hypothetical protein